MKSDLFRDFRTNFVFYVFILFLPWVGYGQASKPDSLLIDALKRVYLSDSISNQSCIGNTQVLIRSAIKRKVDLEGAHVLVFRADREHLYLQSLRWTAVPGLDFHVVLEKDGWVYDFAAESTTGKPIIYRLADYFPNLFPRNSISNVYVRKIPALSFLEPEDRTLAMDDSKTFSYIRKIWERNGEKYNNKINSGPAGLVKLSNYIHPKKNICRFFYKVN